MDDDGKVFYLLICRLCGNGDLVMPFGSQEERGKWAGAHTRGTGHDRWFVTESDHRLTDAGVTALLAEHDRFWDGIAAMSRRQIPALDSPN